MKIVRFARAIVLFWKALTLFGSALICYANVTTHMPVYGHVILSILALGWFAMFLFLQPDV